MKKIMITPVTGADYAADVMMIMVMLSMVILIMELLIMLMLMLIMEMLMIVWTCKSAGAIAP